MTTLKPYFYALLLFSGVVFVKLWGFPIFKQTPLILIFPLMLGVSWFLGRGPGIMTALLSAALTVYLLLLHDNSPTAMDLIQTIIALMCITCLVVIIEYIRHQRVTQKEWNDSQKGTINAFESLEIASVIGITDDFKIKAWNRGAACLFGYEPEEAIGTLWHKLFTGEDIRSGVPEKILAFAREKGAWTGEVWRAKKSGRRFWATLIVVRIRDGYQCIARDITHQKNLEESLERLKNIFYHGAWAVAITDARDDIITHANPAFAAMHGYSPEELSGKPLTLVFAPEFLTDLPKHINAAHINHKNEYTYDSVHIKRNGQRFPCRTYVSVYRDDQGKPLYRVGIVMDVTDQRKLERDLRQRTEELRLASQQKDDFLATVAHELRNPLQPIRTAIHLYSQGGEASQVMDLIVRNVNQIQRLVDDLMDVTRIGRGKVQLQKNVLDLRDALALAIEQSHATIKAKGHKLYKSLPTEPIHVEADVSRLQQIFSNLLNNAAKYTDEGGSIWLTVEESNGHVSIKVRDNGIGISADMLPKIFDLYTQSDLALHKAQGGLGIGLTLVKRLVELHEGTVHAYSEGVGKGSTFVVRLPTTKSQPETAIGSNKIFSGHQLHDRKILVVDDNIDAANSMQMMFAMEGCDVLVANDGEEALRVYEKFKPEIVLLDIGLPKMNGYEVARRIRAQDKGVTLIAVTGYGQPADIQRSIEVGFDAHTVKPVEPCRFKRLVQTTFEDHNTG